MTDLFYLKFTEPFRMAHTGSSDYPKRTAWSQPRTPVLCESGWHACRAEDIFEWFRPELHVVRLDGVIEGPGKVVGSRFRFVSRVKAWNERSQRELAADFAEHVLPNFEKLVSGDSRPRDAIQAARLFAAGKIDSAASSAAYSAAHSAANSAAHSAANSAASSAAYSAARSAASSAAHSAADSAVRSVAYSAELRWQVTRFFKVLGLNEADFAHRG